MPFQPRSLSGEDERGQPRGSFTAAQLLERLDRPEMRTALQAAQVSAEVYERALRERAMRHVKSYESSERLSEEELEESIRRQMRPSQERVLMQGLGIALELATPHHPPLRTTFPWLVKWVRRVLEYVVELENRVGHLELDERGLKEALVRVNQKADEDREAAEVDWAELNSEKNLIERELLEAREELAALKASTEREAFSARHELDKARHQAAAAEREAAAWKGAAHVAYLALDVIRGEGDPPPTNSDEFALVVTEPS